MENGPKLPHELPAWEDIDPEMIYGLIADGRLDEARQALIRSIDTDTA